MRPNRCAPLRRLALLTLVLPAAACASMIGGDSEEYQGIYERGFEADAFHPCGTGEAWWVTGGEDLHARYAEVTERDYQPVYVVVRGELSEPGSWGHLGGYDRQIDVEELIAMDPQRTRCPAGR